METERNYENPTDPYAKLLEIARGEIEALAGAEKAHLRWFERQHPANRTMLSDFILHIADSSRARIPLSNFGTLVNLWVALHMHIWSSWMVRDQLKTTGRPVSPFTPGNAAAN